jgi:hypothetical protein
MISALPALAKKGYLEMKPSQILVGAIAAAALTCLAPLAANAGPRPACGLFSLAEIRAVVGSPVDKIETGLSTPTVRGDATFSTCMYAISKGLTSASSFSLMWAPRAELVRVEKFYVQRKAQTQFKGDVLVIATVTKTSDGTAVIDQLASKKLLAAVLAKL